MSDRGRPLTLIRVGGEVNQCIEEKENMSEGVRNMEGKKLHLVIQKPGSNFTMAISYSDSSLEWRVVNKTRLFHEKTLSDKCVFLFFPPLQEIQNKLTQREQELAERARAAETGNQRDKGPASNESTNQNLDAIQMSALTNLLVVVGFALFAWTVTYVVSTLSEEEG